VKYELTKPNPKAKSFFVSRLLFEASNLTSEPFPLITRFSVNIVSESNSASPTIVVFPSLSTLNISTSSLSFTTKGFVEPSLVSALIVNVPVTNSFT
jgi:hypothetical protein